MKSVGGMVPMPIQVRWLGKTSFREAADLQRALNLSIARGRAPAYLLLLEHKPVYTLGRHAEKNHVILSPREIADLGLDLVETDRGGDVTFHGPGQLVAYPIMKISRFGSRRWTSLLEEAVIDAVARFGIRASRDPDYPGVWIGDRKLCAIGTSVHRSVTMHGLALNVTTNLDYFEGIVPCGIRDRTVTSMEVETGTKYSIRQVAEALVDSFSRLTGARSIEFIASSWPEDTGTSSRVRMRDGEPAGSARNVSDGRPRSRSGVLRPEYMRARAQFDEGYRKVRSVVHGSSLTTVCEEARCPNIHECWRDLTATFMILGDRCTRACGFCNVVTARPHDTEDDEPARVAKAAAELGLRHIVITSVARDDLPDGGAVAFAETVRAVRARIACSTIEVLVPDFKGDLGALETLLSSRPDVINHNVETVPRLQKRVRPSASYARSLTLLARAKMLAPEIETKSGLIVGLGEEFDELCAVITDLASVGVSILTVGQYLQPTRRHLPVERWWTPGEFRELADVARSRGITAVQSGPLVRSSYRAADVWRSVEKMKSDVM